MLLQDAEKRSKIISSVQYSLNLVLPKASQYMGTVEITFTLQQKDHIFIDYSGREIGDIIMNGTRLDAANVFMEHRIKLRPENQIIGTNIV